MCLYVYIRHKRSRLKVMFAQKTLELRWILHGVDTEKFPRMGGQQCVDYIDGQQKLIETIFVCILGVAEILYGLKQIRDNHKFRLEKHDHHQDENVRKTLLLILAFVFGIEMGIKVATHTVIWALNPCHVLTCAQVSFFPV